MGQKKRAWHTDYRYFSAYPLKPLRFRLLFNNFWGRLSSGSEHAAGYSGDRVEKLDGLRFEEDDERVNAQSCPQREADQMEE